MARCIIRFWYSAQDNNYAPGTLYMYFVVMVPHVFLRENNLSTTRSDF